MPPPCTFALGSERTAVILLDFIIGLVYISPLLSSHPQGPEVAWTSPPFYIHFGGLAVIDFTAPLPPQVSQIHDSSHVPGCVSGDPEIYRPFSHSPSFRKLVVGFPHEIRELELYPLCKFCLTCCLTHWAEGSAIGAVLA